jgi:hypothetical protein
VVDVASGRLVEKAVEPAAALVKALLFPRWSGAFEAIQLNLREHVDRRKAADREFTEKVLRSLQAGEADALVAGFMREAAQATTEAQMRMLAGAAAGVFVPDLDSEERPRVLHALQVLELSDAVLLRELGAAGAELWDTTRGQTREATTRREGFANLIRAGCASTTGPVIGGTQYAISGVGRAVLVSLASGPLPDFGTRRGVTRRPPPASTTPPSRGLAIPTRPASAAVGLHRRKPLGQVHGCLSERVRMGVGEPSWCRRSSRREVHSRPC